MLFKAHGIVQLFLFAVTQNEGPVVIIAVNSWQFNFQVKHLLRLHVVSCCVDMAYPLRNTFQTVLGCLAYFSWPTRQ